MTLPTPTSSLTKPDLIAQDATEGFTPPRRRHQTPKRQRLIAVLDPWRARLSLSGEHDTGWIRIAYGRSGADHGGDSDAAGRELQRDRDRGAAPCIRASQLRGRRGSIDAGPGHRARLTLVCLGSRLVRSCVPHASDRSANLRCRALGGVLSQFSLLSSSLKQLLLGLLRRIRTGTSGKGTCQTRAERDPSSRLTVAVVVDSGGSASRGRPAHMT